MYTKQNKTDLHIKIKNEQDINIRTTSKPTYSLNVLPGIKYQVYSYSLFSDVHRYQVRYFMLLFYIIW